MGHVVEKVLSSLPFDTEYASLEEAFASAGPKGYQLMGVIGERVEVHLRSAPGPTPSQFLRRLISYPVGAGDRWNWRDDWNLTGVERTCRIWRSPF